MIRAQGGRAAALRRFLVTPTDALPLLVLRVSFGLLIALSAARFVAKGWVEELYLAPSFHFTYFGFSWIEPPSAPWIYGLFATLFLGGLLLAAGVGARWTAAGVFVLFTTAELFDKALYLNHYVLVSSLALLFVFLPLAPLRGRSVPRWALAAARLQVGLVYAFAGLGKLEADWLLRAEPLSTWLPARAEIPFLGVLLEQSWVAFAASWGALAFDLSLPFLLLWGRSRLAAWTVAALFHACTALLFEIGLFPWIMLCATLVFFTGEELHRFFTRATGRARRDATEARVAETPRASLAATPAHAAAVSFLLLLQLLLPLRHAVYPGDVLWTEEGYRFSWRVMLAEKNGHVVFWVEPPGEAERAVYPSELLTRLQEHQMSYQPDMILELAHHLAYLHGEGTRVRAEARVSLNGRRSRLLIDPSVDLASRPRSLKSQSWILR
ncbi:MAG: HTTM domain-containing protein [Acidobacteriota bacterium]